MSYFEKVFHAVILSVTFGFYGALAFADDYGYTLQLKCEQKDNGRQVVCWMVEVPNEPVVGIDVEVEESK